MVNEEDTGAGRKPAPFSLYLYLGDSLWLLGLALYVLMGMSMVPFHGDESMQIYASHDYATLLIHRRPDKLIGGPPYPIDSDQHLRIINGSINRYTIGMAWHLAGMNEDDLPLLWSWPESYQANLDAGRHPNDALLTVSRIPSTTFLILSIAAMFALGRQFGKRPLAYLASGLYALNPIILLNGRRAMQEGAFLCFGLLALLMATLIVRQNESVSRKPWLTWCGLAVTSGLAIASKHNTAVFVAGAFGGILVAEFVRHRRRALPSTLLKLGITGLASLGLFISLSPALWNNPIARSGDLMHTRQDLLKGQITAHSNTLLAPHQRLVGLATQPFLTLPQYFETRFWAEFDPITEQIDRYEASHLSGLRFGILLGIPLTILYCLGIGVAFWTRVRPYPSQALTTSLMVWLAMIIASVLVNPLPWQRYYLQVIPLASLLAGIGMMGLTKAISLHIDQRSGL
ncbi:MAG: glycosyltransferase family 39 protein [Anaerolineae bacterium]|nr:glycosyltransferase family 39 protein [Anaerolineae bacterium]